MNEQPPLLAREVYQLLKDVAQGERRWCLLPAGSTAPETLKVEIDGWQMTLLHEHGALQQCVYCRAPDGREGSLEHWHRSGTDPLAFLSVWENRQIERSLERL